MKYVLLFVETEQFEKDLDAMSQTERDRAFELVGKWLMDHGDKIHGGSKLQPAHTATTVRLDRGDEPVVTDGPFVEGKEIVSGYIEVEVADLDEALRMGPELARLPDRGDPTAQVVTSTGQPPTASMPHFTELARVARDHAGRLAASLVHLLGDFAAAEDLVQDAVVTASSAGRSTASLPSRGVAVHRRPPPRPRPAAPRARYRTKLAQLQWPASPTRRPAPADLHLLPPRPPPAAQVALTLRVVCGLTTARSPAPSSSPRPPSPNASPTRNARSATPASPTGSRRPTSSPPGCREVLAVIYLLFNEGYLSTTETHSVRPRRRRRWLAACCTT